MVRWNVLGCCRRLRSKRKVFLRKRWPQQKPRVAGGLPITGLPKEIGPHDEQIAELVKKSGAVGVSFAIAVNRKLKVARGVGHLSSHERLPATPTAPGYLGSVTKPLCRDNGADCWCAMGSCSSIRK